MGLEDSAVSTLDWVAQLCENGKCSVKIEIMIIQSKRGQKMLPWGTPTWYGISQTVMKLIAKKHRSKSVGKYFISHIL